MIDIGGPIPLWAVPSQDRRTWGIYEWLAGQVRGIKQEAGFFRSLCFNSCLLVSALNSCPDFFRWCTLIHKPNELRLPQVAFGHSVYHTTEKYLKHFITWKRVLGALSLGVIRETGHLIDHCAGRSQLLLISRKLHFMIYN